MAHEMHMGDDGILRVKFSGDFDTPDVEAYLADFVLKVTGARNLRLFDSEQEAPAWLKQ